MQNLKRYAPSFLSILFLVIFAYFITQNVHEFRDLLRVSPLLLFLILALALMISISHGLINFLLYRSLGAGVGLLESISLAAANSLANLLPFAGGMVAKGIYLKQRFGLSYTRFLSATMALFVIMVASSGAVGLATLAYVHQIVGMEIPPLLVAGFLAMLLSLAILWVPPSLLPSGRWTVQFEQFLNGWHFMRRQPRLLLQLLLLQLGLMLVLAGRYWAAFHLMSQPTTFTDCLLFAAGTTLTQLVTITPDGLGIREAIVGGTATLLGFDLGASVVAVTIDRLVSTAMTIALGSLALYYLARRLGAYAS